MTGLAVGTGGYEAEPEEARAIAEAILGPIAEGWGDDLDARYSAVTSALVTYQAAVDLIAAERARLVAGMHSTGRSYQRIADRHGMSRGRAQQLTEAGRKAADSAAA